MIATIEGNDTHADVDIRGLQVLHSLFYPSSGVFAS